jgi:hypothetical protein
MFLMNILLLLYERVKKNQKFLSFENMKKINKFKFLNKF